MEGFTRVGKTSAKAALLATCIFWVMIASKEAIFDSVLFILIPISFLILFMISFFAILLTILPFYEYENGNPSNHHILKKYFPYYSITIFGLVMFNIIYNNYDFFAIIFSITTFITAIQSWVWFYKTS